MSEQIKELTVREQCRLKLPIFYGSRDNYYHGVLEVLANSSDVITNNYDNGEIILIVHNDMQTLEIIDTGVGVPIGGETDGEPNYIKLFSKLFAGTNYHNLEKGKTTTGTNGCGTCVLNHTSEIFEVTAFYENVKHIVKFKDGGEFISYDEEPIKQEEMKHGSVFKFKLDKEVYTNTVFDFQELSNIIERLSSTSNKLTCTIRTDEQERSYHYDTESDYLREKTTNNLCDFISFPVKTFENKVVDPTSKKEVIEMNTFNLTFSLTTEPFQETYLNGTYLKEGGTIQDGIVDGFKKFFNKENDKKVTFSDEDILMSLSFYGKMLSTNAEYSNQTKFSTGKKLYKTIISKYVLENLEILKNENPKIFKQINEHLLQINKFNKKNDDAIKKLKKTLKETTSKARIEGLKDCDMRHSTLEERILILDEGLSANSTIIDSFDNRYMGCIGLRGRFINALKSSVKDVLNNVPAQSIIGALGCGIEIPKSEISLYKGMETFNIDNLRYGKIAILCDADSFGKGISLSLLSFFKKFMPTLLKQERVYLVISPRFEVKDKKRNVYYAYNEKERDEIVEKLGGNFGSIGIKKGLGEFDKEEFWDYVLSPEARKNTFFKVVYEGEEDEISEWFDTLMGEDIHSRKAFVRENIVNVDLNSID